MLLHRFLKLYVAIVTLTGQAGALERLLLYANDVVPVRT